MALATVFVFLGGPFAGCEGWLSTAEARMACCANEQECPMHKAGQHPSGSNQRISQSDADRCCAASEDGDSLPSSAKATGSTDDLALVPAVLPVAFVSALTRSNELVGAEVSLEDSNSTNEFCDPTDRLSQVCESGSSARNILDKGLGRFAACRSIAWHLGIGLPLA